MLQLPSAEIALVFDEDVDIWDDNRVKWAIAFLRASSRHIIIPERNTLPVDTKVGMNSPPSNASRLGLGCTTPLVVTLVEETQAGSPQFRCQFSPRFRAILPRT